MNDVEILKKRTGSILIFLSVAVTFFVTPWNSLDPVNLPKLFLMGTLVPIALVLNLNLNTILWVRKFKFFNISFLLLNLTLFMSFLLAPQDWAFKFYGTPNRNTGFLAYLSLNLIFFVCVISSSKELLKKFSFAILGVGSILSIYGLAQSQGLDLFNYVNAYASNVFTTFGNPNFHSAFMGITASVALTLAIFAKFKRIYILFLVGLTFVALVNVYLSSVQGYLNFMSGICAALIVAFYMNKNFRIANVLSFFSFIAGLLVAFAIFDKGPLASVLYKASLQAREFYWQTALKIMFDNPFFGAGPDSYVDLYRRNRSTVNAAWNPGVVSDTAHSVPLDMGANYGIFYFILYLLFIALVLRAIVKVIKRSSSIDPFFCAIVSAWVAYQSQSLISINQIGVGIWGWSLSGLLIGYEMNSINIPIENSRKHIPKKSSRKEVLPASAILLCLIAGIIGFVISFPPYHAANKYYKAIQSGDYLTLIDATKAFPNDRARYFNTASTLIENNLDKEAIIILKQATKLYPDNYDLWFIWSRIPSASQVDIARAIAETDRLDPYLAVNK